MKGELTNIKEFFNSYLTHDNFTLAIRIVLIIGIGLPLVILLSRLVGRIMRNKASAQTEMLLKRFVYYTGIIIIVVTVMNELGFKISALLGAAGVLGIAIGFASQTSVSNIISGIFLISERPFSIGDIVQVGETVGYVISIDLLSIKVKTFDNRFVRIPNENMIKMEITNLTKFETRRVNLRLSVAYTSDLNKVSQILQEIAENEALALKEPQPTIQFDQFEASGIGVMFGVWGKKDDYILLRNALVMRIMERFAKEGIVIPYQHVVIVNATEFSNKKVEHKDGYEGNHI